MYISVYDLGLFILFIVAVAVGIYLIAVLRQFLLVVGYVRGILDDHGDDIRETLSLLPSTLTNINELVTGINAMLEQAGETICTVQEDVIDKVQSLQDGLETLSVYAKVIAEIFRAIFNWRAK